MLPACAAWLKGGNWPLWAVLVLAVLPRLYHIGEPLLDGMSIKQVHLAQKARQIAGPPFNIFRSDFDFLEDNGQRLRLTEEVPLYPGLLAAAYAVFGEHEWFGQLGSILASLFALAAFYDLMRREYDQRLALLSTFLLAFCPVFIFYGRAYQPDVSMLACMLMACAAYRRYLDSTRAIWLLTAGLAGAVAALFKYYGVLVLLPLAFMAYRQAGWRMWFSYRFLAPVVLIAAPLVVWMVLVFLRTDNPASRGGRYFIFQMPELLLEKQLYERLLDRFLMRSCGPVTGLLLLTGIAAGLARRVRTAPLWGWTVAALLFYFLLGPMLRSHVYYELLLLPAAAGWAGLGWRWLWGAAVDANGSRTRWGWCGVVVLAFVGMVHSPLVMGGHFEAKPELLVVAHEVQDLCKTDERFVIFGPVEGVDVIHYARREGWSVWCHGPLTPSWPEALAHYRALGAHLLVLYVDHDLAPADRDSYHVLVQHFPVLRQHAVQRTVKGQPCTDSIYLLSLEEPLPAAAQAVTNAPRTPMIIGEHR